MISAKPEPPFGALAARLTARAEALARVRAERDALSRRDDSTFWRRAKLLWPFFPKE